jgi:hypothetical protein
MRALFKIKVLLSALWLPAVAQAIKAGDAKAQP